MRAYFDPCLTQPRVQSAALPGISCLAPHMASLTSPVKVSLLPAASAGTAAIPINICAPSTAAAIRFVFILLSPPVNDVMNLEAETRLHLLVSIARFSCKPKVAKIFCPVRVQFQVLLLLETDFDVHGLIFGVRRAMRADAPLNVAWQDLSGIA